MPTAAQSSPPPDITRSSYAAWLKALDSDVSPFLDPVFDWYDANRIGPLPSAVHNDPDRIYVTVDDALRQAIAIEDGGDAPGGTTIGFEAYSLVDAPISIALEALLFHYGKPIGKLEGETYPLDYNSVFATCHCAIKENWGASNYLSTQAQTAGGIAKDLHDDFTVLVRGNANQGYAVFDSFFRPTPGAPGGTETSSHIAIYLLKPLSNGATEVRLSVRRNGQNYSALLGLDQGRRQYGFNVQRDRSAQKKIVAAMMQLKDTGRITEKRPH